jgi:transposase
VEFCSKKSSRIIKKRSRKMSKRKNHSSSFKAKVAVEAIKNEKTLPELSQIYGVHPNLIGKWKKEALENLEGVFAGKIKSQENTDKTEKDELYKKIGKLEMQVDYLKNLPGLH